MPSKSPAQHRFMEAAAHDKYFAHRAGISPKVAREFTEADANHPEEAEPYGPARRDSDGLK